MSHIRVRFAPSPTGFLHVGGLRTALYNYLFAKKHGGTFVLRIEDTDQKRFVSGAAENLIHVLDSMGIQHDEGFFIQDGVLVQKGEYGPYVQSERLEIYREYVQKLIDAQKAYYCFCSAGRLSALREEQIQNKQAAKYDKFCLSLSSEEREERLQANEPHVIRLDVDESRGDIVFDDIVRGTVIIHAKDVDDQVLLKSDGFPTYHLAVVVDDYLMRISHVIRGEEWISSTPKHILLYEALGFPIPQFAHIPLLLNPDKTKLAKRQGDVAVEDFLQKGYLTEALINFIALLGWNPGQGSTQEIFSLNELVEIFDLQNVHKSGAVLDLKKLDWMNAEYIKRLSVDELYERVSAGGFLAKDFVQGAPDTMQGEEYVKKVLTLERERLVRLADVGENNKFFFTDEMQYESALLHWKQNTAEMTQDALEKAQKILSELDDTDWENKETVEKVLMEAAGEYRPAHSPTGSVSGRGDFLWPLRVALTGVERSPSPFDVAWVLGKDESLKRIGGALEKLK